MSKVIVVKSETIVESCKDCGFERFSQPFEVRSAVFSISNVWDESTKCTKKKPYKDIDDRKTIPKWCPLPDWK